MAFFQRTGKKVSTRRTGAVSRAGSKTAGAHPSSLARQKLKNLGPGRNSRTERHEQQTVPASARNERIGFFERFFEGYDWGRFRITLVFCLFGFMLLGLWARAWYLQMLAGPELAEKARRQHITSEMVTGKRGMILDRSGQVLARSVEALSVYAKPAEITDCLSVANTLGPLLGVAPQQLFDELSQTRRRFLWLKRKVDDYTAEAIRKEHLPGIGLSKEYERVYPFKHMAGQLLGFVGFDDSGLEGLERSLEPRLACQGSRQIVQRDAMGRRFYMREEGQEDPHGEDVTLTIDVQMQFFAEEAVAKAVREADARWGGALVVHVPTGEILAWAQYPFFNPNIYRQSRPQIYRNRLAQDALEPGSTFKPFVMAAAMQEHKVTRNTTINCEGGRWKTKYTTIRDTSSHGEIPAYKVLRYSSNIGMAKIGLMLGSHAMYRYLHELGFGERSNVPITESRGILRTPRNWSEVDTMSTSFGQSVSVTALQMVQAYMTLLNNGVTKQLTLIREKQPAVEPRDQIFSEPVTREVKRMMLEVVEEKDGTGRRAAIDGIPVAGKTGTAQKADRRAGAYGSKRLASFVGFLPADNPLYLIYVLIDEPQHGMYGGIIAAPVFKEIAQHSVAYAGVVGGNGSVKKQPDAVVSLDKKEGKQPRGRGLKISEADTPFEKIDEGHSKERVASLAARQESSADTLKLPGHLAKPSATVPDVQGKTLRNAVELFARAGFVPELRGQGTRVVKQSPAPGSAWPDTDGEEKNGQDGKAAAKTEFILWLSEK